MLRVACRTSVRRNGRLCIKFTMITLCSYGLASCSTSARRPLCGGAARLREPYECTGLRAFSHCSASTSHSTSALSVGMKRHRLCNLRRRVVAQVRFDPPPFQPDKLTVVLAAGTTALEPAPPLSRKYTLTHNDITGNLRLTIGPDYDEKQISGFYTRLLRDEIVAEWMNIESSAFALHVHCHVSGEERWLAPPLLRNYIFRREMPLVLDTLVYADQQLLQAQPQLARAQVYIHFQSSVKELDTVEYWGILGDRTTWPKGPTSIMLRMIYAVVGWPPSMPPLPADLSVDLPVEVLDVEEAVRLQQRYSAAPAELELLLHNQQVRGSAAEAGKDHQMQPAEAQAWSRPHQLLLGQRLQVGLQEAMEAGQLELMSLDERSQMGAVSVRCGWSSQARLEANVGQPGPSSLKLGQQLLTAMQAQGHMEEASQAVRSRLVIRP